MTNVETLNLIDTLGNTISFGDAGTGIININGSVGPDTISTANMVNGGTFDLTNGGGDKVLLNPGLVSNSGANLFVSIEPDAIGPAQTKALKAALALAAKPQPIAEPLDWMTTINPRQWKLRGKLTEFTWMPPNGASPSPWSKRK